jgi:hypothetical protein
MSPYKVHIKMSFFAFNEWGAEKLFFTVLRRTSSGNILGA